MLKRNAIILGVAVCMLIAGVGQVKAANVIVDADNSPYVVMEGDDVNNIIVKSGGVLNIDLFAVVQGNIVVQKGGDLTILPLAEVTGNIVANRAENITIQLAKVGGNIVASKTELGVGVLDTEIGGNVVLTNNDALFVEFSNNTVNGNVIATGNAPDVALFIENNIILGNLIAVNNDVPDPPFGNIGGNMVSGNEIVH